MNAILNNYFNLNDTNDKDFRRRMCCYFVFFTNHIYLLARYCTNSAVKYHDASHQEDLTKKETGSRQRT